MDEIVLSHTYNYPDQSMMVSINPDLVHESTPSSDTPPRALSHEDNYVAYSTYNFQPVPVEFTSVPDYNQSAASHLGHYRQTTSNGSESTSPSPPSINTFNSQTMDTEPNHSQPKTDHVNMARVKEMITRANSVPTDFYQAEFLEYSKETYEKKMESKRINKRKKIIEEEKESKHRKSCIHDTKAPPRDNSFKEDIQNTKQEDTVSNAEIRRQIHIQSEQKRRAQIKDGFDELRKHLPGCNIKKMSKAALLTRTIQQLQHLKGMQNELLSEVERLLQENEALKKYSRSDSACALF